MRPRELEGASLLVCVLCETTQQPTLLITVVATNARRGTPSENAHVYRMLYHVNEKGNFPVVPPYRA